MKLEDGSLCKACILPCSNAIRLDDRGLCQLCASIADGKQIVEEGGEETDCLETKIEKIRTQGKGMDYECIVGFSGGRDSTYLLHLLTQKHHLRCLAGYYRTPFTSDTTDANVRRIASKLNVPLIEIGVSQHYHKRIAREMVMLWKRKPHPVVINMACAPCKFLFHELYRLAEKEGIPNIICGENRFEEVQIAARVPSSLSLTSRQQGINKLKIFKQIMNNFMLIKKGCSLLVKNVELWKHIPLGIQASLMYNSMHTPYLRLRFPRISTLEYFYFADWDEKECEKALSELGWELPPGCNSTWKSDCCFAELKNAMFKITSNTTYMDAFLSNLVRNGKITRDEAIARKKTEGAFSQSRLSQACEILNLPDSIVRMD